MCLVAGREKMFTWKLSKGLVLLCDLWRSGNRSEQQGGLRRSSVPNPGLTRSVPRILFPLKWLLSQGTLSPLARFTECRALEKPLAAFP